LHRLGGQVLQKFFKEGISISEGRLHGRGLL
jgi:hypothetical protein